MQGRVAQLARIPTFFFFFNFFRGNFPELDFWVKEFEHYYDF